MPTVRDVQAANAALGRLRREEVPAARRLVLPGRDQFGKQRYIVAPVTTPAIVQRLAIT
jgi:hypothetical protein